MYNITGWSGGGRRPLSYNLMPGQFRNTRVNVFSQPMIINNNIGGFGGCYDYDCGCGCGGSNKMSWMDWTMMGGMLLNGLGNMFACFWGGGGGGGAEKAKADTPNDKTLKTQAQELAEVYGVDKGKVKVIDGTIYVNINGKVTKCEDLEELENALSGAQEKSDGTGALSEDPRAKEIAELKAQVDALKAAKSATQEDPQTLTSEQIDAKKKAFAELFNSKYISDNFNDTTGKLKVKVNGNDEWFDTPKEAYTAYSKGRDAGTGAEVISGKEIEALADIFKGTMSVIDDSDIGDFKNVSVSNFDATKKTVKIGNRTYNIEIKGAGQYVYLKDKAAGDNNNNQVYILQKTSDGTYQIIQRPDLADVDASGGWNKSATS